MIYVVNAHICMVIENSPLVASSLALLETNVVNARSICEVKRDYFVFPVYIIEYFFKNGN